MKRNNKKRGFTIVELVIVIAVIAILAAVLIPTYANLVKKANEAAALSDAKNLVTEMLANILSGGDDAADIVIVTKKGDEVYVHGYDASEGQLITYKDNPVALTGEGDFYAQAQKICEDMVTAKKLNAVTVEAGTWRDSETIKANVTALGFKAEETAVFANYEIVSLTGTVAEAGDVTALKSVFANAKAGEDLHVVLTGDVVSDEKTIMALDGNVMEAGDITIIGANIVSNGTNTSEENRGVQFFSLENATVNLVNCTIEMKANDYSYPVKIGGTSKNLTVNITGCTLTGANCIENFGTNCTVNITDCVLNSNYEYNATYCGEGIQDNGNNNTYNVKNTTFNGSHAEPWESEDAKFVNDLGGNTFNMTTSSGN